MSTLGRRIPTTWEHVEKYPLTLSTAPDKPVPVTIGVNWYNAFDNPAKDADGKWWAGKDPNNLGTIRGGHCVAIPHNYKRDTLRMWKTFDQGSEGACVGFGSSRMMTLLNNRRMYDPFWLWGEAKEIDEWTETKRGDNNGTSVRAAMDVLRTVGHKRLKAKNPTLADGIDANRWATNIDDLFSVLQNKEYEQLAAIPFMNSWGETYPHIVWVPCETWQRLLTEDGEATMITDK